MKAKPRAIRAMVLAAKAAGKSFEVVAAEFGVPLGTVKTWWSRHRHTLRVDVRKLEHETLRCAGKEGADETLLCSASFEGHAHATVSAGGSGPGWHRGLRACHMPGRRVGKQMTFALFERGMWPPAVWKVPGHLVGGELLMLLQERASMGKFKGPESVPPAVGDAAASAEGLGKSLSMCRGITRWDLPGKSVYEQSVNFRNLRKGTYPPKCWKIPGYLEGKELVEAIKKANAAKGRGKKERTH